MDKGSKKSGRIDLRQEQRKPRRDQHTEEEKDRVESPELAVDELEPRVAPRPIGTFF